MWDSEGVRENKDGWWKRDIYEVGVSGEVQNNSYKLPIHTQLTALPVQLLAS